MDIQQSFKRLELLDLYNIFDLMGLSEMSAESKSAFILDLNELIFTEFLGQKIDAILTKNQTLEIQRMIQQDAPLEQVLSYIQTLVPNFNDLLADFSREVKVMVIRNHYQTIIDDCEKMGSRASSDSVKATIAAKQNTYTTAREYLDQGEWAEIVKLFSSSPVKN